MVKTEIELMMKMLKMSENVTTAACDNLFVMSVIPKVDGEYLQKLIREGFATGALPIDGLQRFNEIQREDVAADVTSALLKMVLDMARNGNALAKKILVRIYQKAFHKEYNQLKQFKRMTFEEFNSLYRVSSGNYNPVVLVQALTMTEIIGIEVEDKNFFYSLLNTAVQKTPKGKTIPFDMKDCNCAGYEEIETDVKGWEEYAIVSEFAEDAIKQISKALKDNEDISFGNCIDWTLQYLGHYYYEDNCLNETVVYFAVFLHKFLEMASNYNERITFLMELTKDICISGKEAIPGLQKISNKSSFDSKSEEIVQLRAELEKELAEKEKLIQENEKLKTDIKDLEGKTKMFADQVRELKTEIKDLEEIILDYEKRLQEPIIVSSNDEENLACDCVDMEQMKKILAERKIAIIGGNQNWVKKIKNRFPNWYFVEPNDSSTLDVKKLNGMDYVFFYSGVLSHKAFRKNKNHLEKNGLEFGYLENTNIDSCVSDIFKQLVDKGIVNLESQPSEPDYDDSDGPEIE